MDRSLKTVLIIGGIVVAVLVILSVVPGLIWGGQYGGWGMMGPGMMGGFGTMGFMGIFWVLVLGLIIWAVVAAVRPGESSSSDSATASSALDVLKKRYARGEINKEEYEEKKRDLA